MFVSIAHEFGRLSLEFSPSSGDTPAMETRDRLTELTESDDLPEWSHAYVGAIVDNDFNLVVSIAKDSNRAVGYKIQHSLRYKAEGERIVTVLERYCEEIGVDGRVREKSGTKYDHYIFEVTRRDDIATFLEAVRPYILVRATAVDLLVGTVIPALEDGAHGEKETFVELMEHIDAFRAAAGRANRSTYDQAFFQEEWDLS